MCPPSSFYIYQELLKCYNIVEYKDESAILKAFQSADAIIPTLSTQLTICLKDKLTSKLLNF
ncbi:21690_t:CDS:2 [Gigaspora rosea]|nr:21690_t:CDS:2 [Gigaspora rosea]